jgi:hypothetical protein
MYAQDERGEKVGEWDLPIGGAFHSSCARSVVHATHEMKPYLTTWTLKVPMTQTGKITLLALIKEGGAGTGAFWYPNDLELTPAVRRQTAFIGYVNQSCDEVCAGHDSLCVARDIASLSSPLAIDKLIVPFIDCQPPYRLSCDDVGATISRDDICYYTNETECAAKKLAYAAPTCAAKSAAQHNGRRLCTCTTRDNPCYHGFLIAGCPCDWSCERDAECRYGVYNTCRNNCEQGVAGCACDNTDGKACGAGFKCMANVCANATCQFGLVDCPCLDGACSSPELVCTPDDFCTRKRRPVCLVGTEGCSCVVSTCV